MSNNVIKFPGKTALFTQPVRQQLEGGITDLTDKPKEAVDRVEQLLCTAIIALVRDVATRIGQRLGEQAGERVARIGR